MANLCSDPVAVDGLLEPSVGSIGILLSGGREQIEYSEHHGTCCPGSGKSWYTLSTGVPGPDPYSVVGSYPHSPGIPEAIAGACLPCDLPD